MLARGEWSFRCTCHLGARAVLEDKQKVKLVFRACSILKWQCSFQTMEKRWLVPAAALPVLWCVYSHGALTFTLPRKVVLARHALCIQKIFWVLESFRHVLSKISQFQYCKNGLGFKKKKPFHLIIYLQIVLFVFVVVLPFLLWILKLACKWVSLRHFQTHMLYFPPSFPSVLPSLPLLPSPFLVHTVSFWLSYHMFSSLSFGPLPPPLKPYRLLVPCYCPVACVWQRGGRCAVYVSIALHSSLIFPLFLTLLWVHTMKYDHILSPNMSSSQLLVLLLFCGFFFLL